MASEIVYCVWLAFSTQFVVIDGLIQNFLFGDYYQWSDPLTKMYGFRGNHVYFEIAGWGVLIVAALIDSWLALAFAYILDRISHKKQTALDGKEDMYD